MKGEVENNAGPVGRKPRRAEDADLSLTVDRAGFEPRCGLVLARRARGFNVRFAPTQRGIRTSSRGSNPARSASSASQNRGRAEIFALPFLEPRLMFALTHRAH